MIPFDYQIFLGFPVNPSFQEQLKQVSIELVSTFIQDHPDYLQRIEHRGIPYLGKGIGSLVDCASVDLIQENIYSLLKRLVPDYPYQEHALILFAIETSNVYTR